MIKTFCWQGLVDYFYTSSIYPNREISEIAAMALVAFILSRRYVTSARNTSSLYFAIVGKTGTGKDAPLKKLYDACKQLLLSDDYTLAIPTAKRSWFEMLDTPTKSNRKLLRVKEFGMVLNQAWMGSVHMNQMLSELCNIWDASDSIYQNNQYVDGAPVKNSGKILERPALTLVGDTVPEIFYPLFYGKHQLAANGFVNRFIVCFTDTKAKMNFKPHGELPSDFIAWHQAVSFERYAMSDEKQIVLNFSLDAQEYISNIDIPDHMLWARHLEQSMKWSICEALIENAAATTIERRHIKNAQEKLKKYRTQFTDNVTARAKRDREVKELAERILKSIQKLKWRMVKQDGKILAQQVYSSLGIDSDKLFSGMEELEKQGWVEIKQRYGRARKYYYKG